MAKLMPASVQTLPDLPPGPYKMGYTGPANSRHPYMVIYDANDRVILSVFGRDAERKALAQSIVDMWKK